MSYRIGPLVLSIVLLITNRGLAQNVTGYQSMAHPELFLVREPAVQSDLGLNPAQGKRLRELNDRVDGPLLALRNWSPKKAREKLSQLVGETREGVDDILEQQQRIRLSQITLRVRGIQSLLLPEVSKELKLQMAQSDRIRNILSETQEALTESSKQLPSGKVHSPLEKDVLHVRAQEQRKILGELTPQQKRQFVEMVGDAFDLSKLGHVAFKAPEIHTADSSIPNRPIRLADLKGQVIAVHFWAFG